MPFWKFWLSCLNEINVIPFAVDVIVVAVVIYLLLLLVRGTRAFQLVVGLCILFALSALAKLLRLQTFNWLLTQFMPAGFAALVIVILFQPEIRHALEQFGRPGFWRRSFALFASQSPIGVINEIIKATKEMTQNKIGALIVLEREVKLNDIIETGKEINGLVSAEFILSLFYPGSPLHDGAIIIRGDRVVAASCLLPLTENPNVSKLLGSRHRAAMGLTEKTDAIAIVVSEETGTLSVSYDGELHRYLTEDTLKERLIGLSQPASKASLPR